MTARRRPGGLAALAALATASVVASGARADDGPNDGTWGESEGYVRAGWRFLHDEEDGRFFQDEALQDGPRLFDAEFRSETDRPDVFVRRVEAEAHGVGDQEQSYGLRLGSGKEWDLSGRLDLDDFSYRATGDLFPYDTQRTRSNLRFRLSPSDRLTVRLDWDRSTRKGDAFVQADGDLRGYPRDGNDAPGDPTDPDFVADARGLEQRSDTATLGVDAKLGHGFRASLAETFRVGQVDESRFYDLPPGARRGPPVSEALSRDARSEGWTTVAKAGWTSPGRTVDVGAIFAYTLQDTDWRDAVRARGFEEDRSFEADVDGDGDLDLVPFGAYRATGSGSGGTDRDHVDGRVEATWQALPRWELTVATERETFTDDARIRTTETRDYAEPLVPGNPRTGREDADYRIVDRICRVSAEVGWDALDTLRLRGGAEYLRENLRVPTDARPGELLPTNFSSTSWRRILGADWKPTARTDFSILVKRGTNDEPHATTSADTSDEVTYRGRWKASDAFTLSTTYRHRGLRQDDALDHASRTDTSTIAATWTWGALAVTPSATWQTADTRTDTTPFRQPGDPSRTLDDQTRFATRDLISSLDVRYDVSKSARAFLTVTRVDANGDYEAEWDDARLGGEVDLRENLTLGAALRSWRLDEIGSSADDYRVVGAEVWVTLRF